MFLPQNQLLFQTSPLQFTFSCFLATPKMERSLEYTLSIKSYIKSPPHLQTLSVTKSLLVLSFLSILFIFSIILSFLNSQFLKTFYFELILYLWKSYKMVQNPLTKNPPNINITHNHKSYQSQEINIHTIPLTHLQVSLVFPQFFH